MDGEWTASGCKQRRKWTECAVVVVVVAVGAVTYWRRRSIKMGL